MGELVGALEVLGQGDRNDGRQAHATLARELLGGGPDSLVFARDVHVAARPALSDRAQSAVRRIVRLVRHRSMVPRLRAGIGRNLLRPMHAQVCMMVETEIARPPLTFLADGRGGLHELPKEDDMSIDHGWRTLAEATYGVTESGQVVRLETGTLLQTYEARGVDPETGCGVKRGPQGASTFLFRDADGWDEPDLAYVTASALRFEEETTSALCSRCGHARDAHRFFNGPDNDERWPYCGGCVDQCEFVTPGHPLGLARWINQGIAFAAARS